MPPIKQFSTLLATLLAGFLLFDTAVAARNDDSETNPGDAMSTFSHDDWTTVLQSSVDDRGFVDYKALAKDRATLDRYLEAIESTGPANHPELFPTRESALAYYINVYNAQIFKGVLARGPEKKSVWRGLVSGLNFFVRMKIQVEGRTTNLKKLEDVDIREGFADPRIHAALNCASVGCPPLQPLAFEAETLDQQLDDAMRAWVADPLHCRVVKDRQVVQLNKIFEWFLDDFLTYETAQGSTDPQLLDYVNRYRAADEQIPSHYKIEILPYDKGINQQ